MISIYLILDFLIIPVIFYIVVLAAGLDLGGLRRSGWLFDMGASAHEPWYTFYTYYGKNISWFSIQRINVYLRLFFFL